MPDLHNHDDGPPPPTSLDETYEDSPDDLPDSRLRPLDDVTLRRFLLADRGQGGGAFDVEASHARLIAVLRFRKERRCDATVNILSSGAVPDHVRKCRRLRVTIWAGSDCKQRPVVFERLGQFFSRATSQSAPRKSGWSCTCTFWSHTPRR